MGRQQWTTLTLPSESLVPSAVTGVSATDEWVFGRDDSGGSTRFPGYRWNGGRWTEQGSKDFEVLAAQSRSASDLWAAGSDRGDGYFHPQVGHWNGSSWSVTRTPVPAGYSGSLTAVHAVSATDVWAAGSINADVANAKSEPYLVHWDGTSWTRAALPGFTEDVRLTSVLVRANGEVWAGGYQSKYVPGKAIVLRGTAQGFGLVPVPDTGDTRLTGFAEDGGTLYAGIGGTGDTTNGLLSWTGSGWQTATGPTAPTRRVGVLTAVPGGGLWAGGADKSGKQFLALR
ncbi:hypothetical protein KALB_3051 [Kutzneria albida DSM 43870]|uniref:Uncharacterized protein n=1 Tax=Kutzneria albida DSM 43870 TaxID=1449976 RepID=W5WE12_9PSEU|nr:hypothetical protein KALB_3051 [Kutzneria albida DSM 43870]